METVAALIAGTGDLTLTGLKCVCVAQELYFLFFFSHNLPFTEAATHLTNHLNSSLPLIKVN